MTKRAKLLKRIRQNPKNVSFKELRTVLEAFGFALKRSRGSHNTFVGIVNGQKKLVVIPYKRQVNETYVRHALDLIAEIEIQDEMEDDENDE